MKEAEDNLALILADGQAHLVANLCQQLAVDVGGLNILRSKLPDYFMQRLKQLDDCWQLREPVVYFSAKKLNDFAQQENINVELLESCPSTNSLLMERIRQHPNHDKNTLLITHKQTAGRGRLDRRWETDGGQALTFSLSWRSSLAQSALSALPLLIALSCQQVLHGFHLPIKIKWPNDLMLNNAKVGGILIESIPHTTGAWCVIGVGLNIHQPSNNPLAAALHTFSNDLPVDELFYALIRQIIRNLNTFGKKGFAAFQAAYGTVHREQGQSVQLWENDLFLVEGIVQGVDEDGGLLLKQNDTIKKFVCGEISLKSIEQDQETMLLLDCGNSQVKWALIKNNNIVETCRTPYSKLHNLSDYFKKIPNIQRIYGSAVCGKHKKEHVARHLPKNISWLASERSACGIHNHYRHPAEHGADRWFNALGARMFSKNACVIVSCGTAITIDALTDSNQYLGGSIMPGFNLMKEAMSDKTANLDRPFGRPYPFATTTPNALASGVLDASVGAILLMHARLHKRVNQQQTDIILTGGGAKRLYHHFPSTFLLDTDIKIVDNLVIFGLLNWIAQQ